jgi:hypothetical protein
MRDSDFRDLKTAIDWAQSQLVEPRNKYRQLIKLSTGTHYATGGAENVQPVNTIKMAERLYVHLLAPKVPRVDISSSDDALKPGAANLGLAVNQRIQELEIEQIFRDVVMEALYGIGVVLCGLSAPGEGDYGTVFVDRLLLDDYFVDISATDWRYIQYEGNDFWMDYDEFEETEWPARKRGDRTDADEYTISGDGGETRAQSISVRSSPTLFKKKIRLRNVWLPRERRFVTYAVRSGKLLRDYPWPDDIAPSHGPYHKLVYASVPGGNLLPMPPAALWRDLHEIQNSVFRKVARQVDGQKTVWDFVGGTEEDVAKFQNALDSGAMATAGAQPIAVSVGGANQASIAFFMICKQLASYYGGNFDAIGGLGVQAETLGQEQLITSSANAMISDMVKRTLTFIRELMRSIATYEFHDPVVKRNLEKPVGNTGMTVPVQWKASDMVGKFSDYKLDIDIFSMADNSPSVRLQKLMLYLEKFVGPLTPMIQQAGGMIDVEAILKAGAKHLTSDELSDIVLWTSPPQQGPASTPASSQNTERTYTRKSTGPSRENADNATIQSLLSGAK